MFNNITKMSTLLSIIALLFAPLAYGSDTIHTMLNDADVSYISVHKDGKLTIHIISGEFDQDKLANLANDVDIVVEIVDYRDGGKLYVVPAKQLQEVE